MIGAVFCVTTPPRLTDTQQSTLLGRLQELRERHKVELQTQEAALQQELFQIEAKLPHEPDTKTDKGKKRKINKGPPPVEVQQFMKRKRTLLRELKAAHASERESFVTDLGNLERLLVEHEVGSPACNWIMNG